MKLKSLLTTLAAAVGLTTAATAATPTVVWDGDFGTKTYSGWTIDYKGNSTADGVLTIDQSVGAVFTGPNSTLNNSTYIIKCTNLDLANANNQYLLSLHQNILGGGNGDASYNKVGVSLAANNAAVRGIWNNAFYNTQGDGHQVASPLTAGTYLAINIQTSGGVFVWEMTEDESGNRTLTKVYGNTNLKASNTNYKGFTLGGIYEKTSSTLSPATGWKISSIAVFNSTLSEAEIKAYRFQSDFKTYTATVSEDTPWSEISWDKTVTDWSTAQLELTVENGAKITMDEDPTFAELNITGTMTIAVDGVTGEDLAKNAVAGAPYSYWLINASGTITGTVAMDPDVEIPGLYTVSAVELVSGYGARAVITAPAKAQFGAVSINVTPESSNDLDGDTEYGLYPQLGADWGFVKGADAVTYSDVTFTPYASSGTFETENGVNANLTDSTRIMRGLAKDVSNGRTIGFDVTGVTTGVGEKYRVIVYLATDSANIYFAPVVINGVTYAGPTEGSSTMGYTIKNSTVNRWGATGGDHATHPVTEGVNAVVSDVLDADTVTIRATRQYGTYATRASIAAVQIVKVGEFVEGEKYTATVSEATDWNDIEWTPSKPEEGFPEDAVLKITAEGNPTITFSAEEALAAPLRINGAVTLAADDSLYEDGCWEKTIAKFGSFTATEATFADIMDGYKGAYTQTETGFKLRGQNCEVISINIAGGSGGGTEGADSPTENIVSGDGFYGIAPTLGDSWNNINGQFQGAAGTTRTITIEGPNAYDGAVITNRPTMSLSAAGKNTYQASIDNPFLRGYLDDGEGVTVMVHGIPYTTYDVIVYGTSDRSDTGIAPVKVNGTYYTFVDGETVEGDTAWGQGMYATPELGKNALKITGCSGDTLTINATREGYIGEGCGRATLCAVQVICTGEVVFKNTYTATISDSTAFEDITWDDEETFEEGQLNEATITVDDSSSNPVEITFGNPEMYLYLLDIRSGRDITFTADSALPNVGQFFATGCTAKVTYNMPARSLEMTTDGSIAYTGGAGSETSAAGITFVENGDLTLTGTKAPYYIGDTFKDNTNAYTMTFTDATVYCKGWAGLAVGMATVTIDGTTTVESERCILSQGIAGQTSVLTVKDDASVTITGESNVDANTSSIMFGHWDGTSTFTLQDNATFTAENAQVLVGKTANNHTINLNGGTFTAKGIKASGSATGTNTLNLAGGALVLGDIGITSYGSTKIDVNVTEDSTITASVATKITQPIVIADGKTLTFDATEGDIALAGAITGNGTIKIVGGNVVFLASTGVDPTQVTVEGTGKAFYGVTVTINDCGRYTPVSPLTTDNVKLYDEAVDPVEATVVGDHFEFAWQYTDGACWWDYEFNGNLTSTGSDTTTMSAEGTKPYYNEGETALRVGYGTPYRDADYPEEFTAVLYGKMVNTNGHMEVGFGSTTGGSKLSVILACGDPEQNEVKLLVTSGQYQVLETVSMKVPNAYDANHLYAFTCQTVDEKTKVSVYLDGKFLQAYTFDSKVTLGSGFQIGSVHGGLYVTGYAKATTANTSADLEFLRVYKMVLNAEAMDKYAEEYPYTSTNGSSARTFDDSLDQTWVAAEATTPWTVTPFNETAYTTNIALAGSAVTVSATAAAEVTMNLTEATSYEALTIGEGSDITIKAGDIEPTITGLTEVEANVTVDYNAISFATVEVAAGKTLTFDFTEFPFTDYYASATIAYTGATSGEGTITAKGLPTEGARTVTFEKNASTDQYELKIVADLPFIYTIGATEEEGTWTFGEGGEEVTQEIVDANTKVPVWKKGDGSMTSVVLNRTYFVKEGTMVAGDAKDKTGAVTVDADATFDFNGAKDGYITVNLNGGSLVNNGGEMGTNSRQMNGIALTENSTIGGTGNFGLVSGGWGANTLDLGSKTLTKTGDNTFWLTHTTVTAGTLDVTAGTIKPTGSAVTFDDDAALVLGEGTTLDNATTLNIGAITATGATINNTGTITPFTLTGSATLSGNGTWGTNTLASGAIVNVGTKRDFVFAGAGTVNATLTAEEVNAGQATLFTPDAGASILLGAIMYNGKDITDKCTVEDNKITNIEREATIGTQYYITLAEALEAAKADETVTLLKNVTVASLTVPETVTLDPTADYTITVDPKTVENNGTIVVYDLATATALKDLDGTLKAGADLDGGEAMFYPQGTTVAHSTEVVESAEHTNNVPTLEVTIPDTKTVVWGQGVNPYQKMYVYGDAEFAGNISAGWDTNKLMTVFGIGGALKLNSDVNIGKYASATAYGTLDMNGKTFIIKDTDAILTTITNLVVGTEVTTDKEGYEVKVVESEGYYYYTIAEKASGPVTPPTGGGSVAPAEGEAGVYIVEPDPSSKTVTIVSGLSETDVIRVTNTVDMTVVGVPASQIEIKIGGTVIPTAAFVGGDDAGFSTALNPNGVVEGVKVQPEIAASVEVPTPFEVGDNVETTVKTIAGLTYNLVRDSAPDGTFETTADSETGDGEPVTLTDTEKPEGKAFYKVQVTK